MICDRFKSQWYKMSPADINIYLQSILSILVYSVSTAHLKYRKLSSVNTGETSNQYLSNAEEHQLFSRRYLTLSFESTVSWLVRVSLVWFYF